MKILAINASFRGDTGYTKFMIEKIFEGAREAGAECENINLVKLKINHCIDCQVCQSQSHYLRCIHEDDVEMIFTKMQEADVIIFATPIYTNEMSSLLKTLLERYYYKCKIKQFKVTKSGLMFHHIDAKIFSKPFIALITCDNMLKETTQCVIDYFKNYAYFMDAKLAGMLVRKQGALTGHGKDEEKEKRFPIIYDIYEAFYQAGKELGTKGIIKQSTQKRASRLVMKPPFILKYLIKLKPVQKLVEKKYTMAVDSAIYR